MVTGAVGRAMMLVACGMITYAYSVAVPGGDEDHDFEDAEAAHTQAGMAWARAGEKALAITAFESAVKFTPNPESLTNLGVTHLNFFADYSQAEHYMLKAWKMAVEQRHAAHVEFVEKNLDILEEHVRSREPISEKASPLC